jgi:hypothetical protein
MPIRAYVLPTAIPLVIICKKSNINSLLPLSLSLD